MNKLILNPEYQLYERKSKAYCSSTQIANEFGKRHDNVLQDIRNLDCSDQFRLLNFQESYYRNEQGKRQPEYLMTKDGFTFLVMGYRGKKAAQFKELYISRFNQMADFIESLQTSKIEFPAFTKAIMDAHEEPKHYHYSNEINMIYRLVLGMDAKKFREINALDKNEVIKPYLTSDQIKAIETLQRVDIGLIVAIPEYENRKQILSNYFKRLSQNLIA